MHDDREFAPLRPRRHGAPAANVSTEITPIVEEMTVIAADSAAASLAVAEIVESREPEAEINLNGVRDEPTAVRHDRRRACDEEERHAALREAAIRFAAIACARALRKAVAADADELTRYVDEALRACGRVSRSVIRLHPDDAAVFRPSREADVVADASLARGAVTVLTDAGSLGATIEERALLLARAAAHA
jgi:hypothetical protein